MANTRDYGKFKKRQRGFADGGGVSGIDLASWAGMPSPGATTESLAAYANTPLPPDPVGRPVQSSGTSRRSFRLPSNRQSAIHKRLYAPEV